jgi:ribonuclease HIII
MYKAVRGSIYDENGVQLLVLMQVHCSKKFRDTATKELANKLNTIRQGQRLSAAAQENNK